MAARTHLIPSYDYARLTARTEHELHEFIAREATRAGRRRLHHDFALGALGALALWFSLARGLVGPEDTAGRARFAADHDRLAGLIRDGFTH
ncbi:hypothetical protein BN2476_1380023 [Paraburkholderia piptadeniae]|nr:hypothetical protein BN2476_1380023 [Paraburkholderia piptadeniae]